MTVKSHFFELLHLLLVFTQRFHVLHSQFLSKFEAFLGVWLKIKLVREEKAGMNLSIHEDIIVEDDSLEVDKEEVRNHV